MCAYANMVSLTEEERRKVGDKMRVAFHSYGYPEWALKRGNLVGKRQVRNDLEKGEQHDH